MLLSVARAWRSSGEAGTTAQSVNIRLCIFLIYYFSLCDSALKFGPPQIAIVLRYLPEALLYFFALLLLFKRMRVLSFPLFWPLCLCAATMTASGLLNSTSMLGVAGDFRIYFRFVAFTYILWRTHITPRRIEQLINGFLGLTVIELAIGGLELIGGKSVQDFFSPALGWGSGQTMVWENPIATAGIWVNGTFSNNNFFGIFMVASCVLALTAYLVKGGPGHLWITLGAAIGVIASFSRHSAAILFIAIVLLFVLHRKRSSTTLKLRRILLPAAMASLLVLAIAASNGSLRDRIGSSFSQQSLAGDPIANIRLFMTLELTPRFLRAYPFFGQGPIPPDQAVQPGEQDTSKGPALKAAPELPGWVTFYLADVVWIMVLGLYGCVGLAAFGYVFWTIAAAARKVIRENRNPESVAAARACLVLIVVTVLSGFFSEEVIARDMIPVFWVFAGMILSLARSTSPRLSGPVQSRSLLFESKL